MFRGAFGRAPTVWWCLAAGLVAGCETRDRPVFTGPGNPPPGAGPTTVITQPTVDTTVSPPAAVFVVGRSADLDGLDTVYFETVGGVSSFPPFIGGGDTVRFGLPITTNGQSGAVVTVRVFGTDRLGNRGDTAIRRITIQ